jgi:23S rRNA pseudouridine1911/1915/1917 synthase
MVVAKNETALRGLVEQFRRRAVAKEYLALVWGRPQPPAGRIETPIGRHPRHRQKMSATPRSGRAAITVYETVETFRAAALLRVRIETGRTHQIRVHMAFLGHAVVGDTQYGRPRREALPVPVPRRQMLHAFRLGMQHPRTGERLTFEAPLPEDMRRLLAELRPTTTRNP